MLERGHLALDAARSAQRGRGPCRRSGSRRRRAAPSARSARSGRPPSARRSRASSSTRPRRDWPSRRTRRSSRGCSACRRRRGRRARCPSPEAGADARGLGAQLVPRPLAGVAHSHAWRIATRRRGGRGRCARDRRARRRVNHFAPGIARVGEHLVVVGLDVEELPDRRPERLEVVGRPVPQRVVGVEAQPALVLQPAHVARHRGALDPLLRRLPEESPACSVAIAGSLRRVSEPSRWTSRKCWSSSTWRSNSSCARCSSSRRRRAMFGLEVQGVTGELWDFALHELEDMRRLVEKISALGGDPTTKSAR